MRVPKNGLWIVGCKLVRRQDNFDTESRAKEARREETERVGTPRLGVGRVLYQGWRKNPALEPGLRAHTTT